MRKTLRANEDKPCLKVLMCEESHTTVIPVHSMENGLLREHKWERREWLAG